MGRRRSKKGPSTAAAPPTALPPTKQKRSDSSSGKANHLPLQARCLDATRANRRYLTMWVSALLVYILGVDMLAVLSRSAERVAPVGLQVEAPGRPGVLFNQSEITCRRPVVLLPGFITTALEVWQSKPCAHSSIGSFRKPVFGPSMLFTMLEDPECYFEHLRLDPETASDPPGVTVRPGDGPSAIDYVAPGYWVWAKVLRNLADVGYAPGNLAIATYDWRYASDQFETPENGFYDNLKVSIERLALRANRTVNRPSGTGSSNPKPDDPSCQRVVVIGHSYAGNVFAPFLRWAERLTPGWTDQYMHAFVNIAAPMLGMPKAMGAVLSGEFRDVATLPRPLRSVVDRSVPRHLRGRAFRSWPALWAMAPRGGDIVWPNVLVDGRTGEPTGVEKVYREFLADVANQSGASALHQYISRTFKAQRGADASETGGVEAMPRAPKLAVYCVYGVGGTAENAYQYAWDDPANSSTMHIDTEATDNGVSLTEGDTTVPLVSLGYACRSTLPGSWRKTVGHVRTIELPVEGTDAGMEDPLASAAAADTNSWERAEAGEAERMSASPSDDLRRQQLNTVHNKSGRRAPRPGDTSGSLSAAKEMLDSAFYTSMNADGKSENSWGDLLATTVRRLENMGLPDPRGGPYAADHVGIMGNYEVLQILLRVATGPSHVAADENSDESAALYEDRILSSIDERTAALDKAFQQAAVERK